MLDNAKNQYFTDQSHIALLDWDNPKNVTEI